MGLDMKTIANVVVGMIIYALVQKFLLSKIGIFNYEEGGYEGDV